MNKLDFEQIPVTRMGLTIYISEANKERRKFNNQVKRFDGLIEEAKLRLKKMPIGDQ